ncbi:MAG: outer membrane beta-barrel protein [Desulfobacteraceae bacterium]|jgi:hypothetical protein
MKRKILPLVCLILLISTDCFSATTFIPRLTLQEEYSDNIYLASDNKLADYITTISPGGTLDVRGRTAGLILDYEPSYVIYHRYSDNDTLRHNGFINLWADFSRRTRFEASNTVLYTEEPFSEFDTTIRTGRDTYLSNIATVNLYHQFGPEDSWNLGYTHRMLDNEDDYIEDTQRHEPYFILTYWPLENEWGTETALRYRKGLYEEALYEESDEEASEYEQSDDFDFYSGSFRLIKRFDHNINGFIRYTHSIMEYDGLTENYNLHEVGPGVSYDIDENTNLSLEIMYLYRDRETSDDEQRLLFVSEIHKNWDLSRSTLQVSGASGYEPDTFGAESMGFNLYAQLEAIYEYGFSRQLQWDVFGRARYDKYIDVDPERVDNTFRTGTGFTYQALNWAELRLEYAYRQVFSEIYEYEHIENRVLLQLVLMPAWGQEESEDDSLRDRLDRRDQFPERNSSEDESERSNRRNVDDETEDR